MLRNERSREISREHSIEISGEFSIEISTKPTGRTARVARRGADRIAPRGRIESLRTPGARGSRGASELTGPNP